MLGVGVGVSEGRLLISLMCHLSSTIFPVEALGWKDTHAQQHRRMADR